jgi:hypothetical protein
MNNETNAVKTSFNSMPDINKISGLPGTINSTDFIILAASPI